MNVDGKFSQTAYRKSLLWNTVMFFMMVISYRIIFYVTLNLHNGTRNVDYSALWWDEWPVCGIVTSFIRLDILSKYSGPNAEERMVYELEIYIGHGENYNEPYSQ